MVSDRHKIPGIIGGVGPEAAASFYLRILDAAATGTSRVRPAVLMASVSLPLDTEEAFLAGDKSTEPVYVESIIQAVRQLERAGADFLAVPSNTVCLLLKSIKGSTDLEVLDPISVTIREVLKRNMRSVEILGTSSIVSSDIYGEKLRKHDCRVVYPDTERQETINRIIRCIVAGTHTQKDIRILDEIVDGGLAEDVDGVVIGCTDLHLVFDKRPTERRVIDSLTVLAQAAAEKIQT